MCCAHVFFYHLAVHSQNLAPPRKISLHCESSCNLCRRQRVHELNALRLNGPGHRAAKHRPHFICASHWWMSTSNAGNLARMTQASTLLRAAGPPGRPFPRERCFPISFDLTNDLSLLPALGFTQRFEGNGSGQCHRQVISPGRAHNMQAKPHSTHGNTKFWKKSTFHRNWSKCLTPLPLPIIQLHHPVGYDTVGIRLLQASGARPQEGPTLSDMYFAMPHSPLPASIAPCLRGCTAGDKRIHTMEQEHRMIRIWRTQTSGARNRHSNNNQGTMQQKVSVRLCSALVTRSFWGKESRHGWNRNEQLMSESANNISGRPTAFEPSMLLLCTVYFP